MISWAAAGGSDVGRRREGNEDAFRLDVERGIFLVADGMGGHAAGEIASDLAATTVAERLARAAEQSLAGEALHTELQRAVTAAHDAISRCCGDDPRTRGMGTTLTACLLGRDGACHVAHIGDSRLYRWRAGVLEQITPDHTWVRREVEAGRLDPEAAPRHPYSHILTRVLSEDLSAVADLISLHVGPGDLLLLATDGLYNMVSDSGIARLAATPVPLPARVAALIDAANRAGGADNISVVLVEIRG